MVNKRLINTGAAEVPAAFDPYANFETVTYTGNGSTQKITGYIRKGAAFNGSSSRIDASNSFPTGNSARSISFWMHSSGYLNGGVLGYGAASSNQAFEFYVASNSLLMTFYAVNANINYALSANQWYHVVATFDGTNFIAYVNGSNVYSDTRTLNTGTGTFRIGGVPWNNSGEFFSGKIDQVRIFNKALSSSEVTTLYGETYASSTKSTTDIFGDGSGVALYELDDSANGTSPSQNVVETNQLINLRAINYTSGSTWTDISGQSNNATLTNPTKPTPESVHFDYANLGAQNQYSGNNVSIEFFIKTTNTDDDYFLTAYDGGGLIAGEMILYIPNSAASGKPYLRVTGSTSSSSQLAFNHTVVQDAWTHYVLVYDSSLTGNTNRFTMYVNGSAVTTSVVGGVDGFDNSNFMGDSSDLFIGKRGGGTDYEEMDIKEFRIYSKSLSSSEVTQNYAASAFRYDGTATNVNYLGMAFQPDLVWIKDRGVNGSNHVLSDSVRGASKFILPNLTNAEITSAGGTLSSFDSNGFTLAAPPPNYDFNINGNSYVAWCWKAAGAAVSNTDGSITSQVSANQAAGFSIVKYTANGIQGATIGHGLSSAPEMIIVKALSTQSTNNNWAIYHSALGNNYFMYFTTDAAFETSVFPSVSSSTISLRSSNVVNTSGDYIAYCFHSVDGYQKIGTYAGTGTSGNIVTTGFRPRFVMYKCYNGAYAWVMVDSIRGGTQYLFANSSNAEGTYSILSFNDTGFELLDNTVTTNGSGLNYIYLAIA